MGSTGSSSFISCPLADHDEITVDDFCFSRNAPSAVVAWVRQLLRAIGNHQIGHLRRSTIDARRVDNNHNQTKPCRRRNDTSPHKPELVERQRWRDRRIQPGALLPPLPNTAAGWGTLREVLPPWTVQGPLRDRSVFAVRGLCCPERPEPQSHTVPPGAVQHAADAAPGHRPDLPKPPGADGGGGSTARCPGQLGIELRVPGSLRGAWGTPSCPT